MFGWIFNPGKQMRLLFHYFFLSHLKVGVIFINPFICGSYIEPVLLSGRK